MNFVHYDDNRCYYYSGECGVANLGSSDSNVYEVYIYEEDNILRNPICPNLATCRTASDGSLVAIYEGKDIY